MVKSICCTCCFQIMHKLIRHRFITVAHFGSKCDANIHAIESKWRRIHASQSSSNSAISNDNNPERPSTYILAMFPYPSGNLHMGHARVYTAADVLARYHRLLPIPSTNNQKERVLFPMGWDAFGLPAENAAITASTTTPIHPSKWTHDNIAQMRQQFRDLNCSFTDDQLSTCHPTYYHQTQQLFKLLYNKNLVYRQSALVNWDPMDGTVLADEQVDAQGRSWRSGAVVVKRELMQWYVRTTALGEALARVEGLGEWPEGVKAMQVQWIGAMEGVIGEVKGRKVFRVEGKREATNDKELSACLGIEYDEGIQPVHLNNHPLSILQTTSSLGHKQVLFRMRDWLVSRQRYWGCPIPVVHCTSCGAHQVVDAVDLPECSVPEWSSFRANPSSSSSEHLREWYGSGPSCSKCHSATVRELDTLDTFFDSSWYQLRFLDPLNSVEPISRDRIRGVDVYLGGIEHAILHLLYARFMGKVLSGDEHFEPFRRLVPQGLVMAKTFHNVKTGGYIAPPDPSQHFARDDVEVTWQKMSKSKLNGVNPSELVARYGSDALRIAILFKAPLEVHMCWEEGDITGAHRWIQRLLHLITRCENGNAGERKMEVQDAMNRTIRGITKDLKSCSFHTCIAHLMTLTGVLESGEGVDSEDLCRLATMLYPFAPIVAAEMYECGRGMVGEGDVREASWPVAMYNHDKGDVLVVVQRDGRKIGTIATQRGINKGEAIAIARSAYSNRLEDASSDSVIYAKGRVLNFVTKDSIKGK